MWGRAWLTENDFLFPVSALVILQLCGLRDAGPLLARITAVAAETAEIMGVGPPKPRIAANQAEIDACMANALRPTRRCKEPVYTVAISPTGDRYLWSDDSPREGCCVTVCEVASNKVLYNFNEHKRAVLRARFLPDDSIVSFSFDSHICRWTAAGELAASNETHLVNRADGFALSSDGKLAVTGDYRGEISGWQVDDGSRCFTIKENKGNRPIWALSLHPKGKRLVSGGAEGKIRIWTIGEKRQDNEVDFGFGNHVYALTWSPDGKTFAAALAPDGAAPDDARSRVVVLDASRCTEVVSLYPDGHQPFCCTFSPDGRLIASAGGGTDHSDRRSKANCKIHIWEVATGNVVANLAGHTDQVRDLAFFPDSSWLLSAAWDNTVRMWRLDNLS